MTTDSLKTSPDASSSPLMSVSRIWLRRNWYNLSYEERVKLRKLYIEEKHWDFVCEYFNVYLNDFEKRSKTSIIL